ncbi:MAG: HupE/UreJ family protein [Rubrivivax sp.]|nr:MAG: HupE/UreJ family protein [Rubrivivax sp.]
MKPFLARRTIVALVGVATGLGTSVASAHVGAGLHEHAGDALSSFAAGATHPLTGLDHLAAMLSVGVWSAVAGGSPSPGRLLAAPLAFATMLLVGALLALNGLSVLGIEPMIAASLLVMGLLVMARLSIPPMASAGLVGGFALFHGLAHGQELAGHATAALAGMVLTTLALHAAGIAAGLALRQRQAWLPRLAGGGVALFGLSLLAPAVAGVL